MSVTDSTFLSSCNGLPDIRILQLVQYSAPQEVPRGHACFRNVASNISSLSPDEIRVDNEPSESGGRPMERTEQKSIVRLEGLVQQFFKLYMPVMDPFVGMMLTVSAFLLAKKHCGLVECDRNAKCVETLIPGLMEVNDSQLLDQPLELTGVEDLMETVCSYLA